MRAIAEGLLARASAGAPEIGPARLQLHLIGTLLRAKRLVGHPRTSLAEPSHLRDVELHPLHDLDAGVVDPGECELAWPGNLHEECEVGVGGDAGVQLRRKHLLTRKR